MAPGGMMPGFPIMCPQLSAPEPAVAGPLAPCRWLSAFVLAGMLAGCLSPPVEPPPPPLVLAVAPSAVSAAIPLAVDRGLIPPGSIELHQYRAGRDCLDAMLAGEADLATVSETPVVHALLAGERPRVLATLAQHPGMVDVIADRGQGIERVEDLVGKRVAHPPRTNAGYVAHAFERFNRLPEDSVKAVSLPIEKAIAALDAGEVAAVAVWSPITEQVMQVLGSRAIKLEGDPSYIGTWNLVARNAEIAADPRVEELLRVLELVSRESLKVPDQATQERIAAWCELPLAVVTDEFGDIGFEIRLDQSLLLLMEDQSRWLDPTREHIEILEAFDPRAILAVDPARCTIIR